MSFRVRNPVEHTETDLMTIHYRGVFDLQGLYRMCKKWFDEKKFEQFFENLYKYKPPELELEWKGERKVTGYYKHIVTLKFHFWGLHEVDVVVDNVTKKMFEGRFFIYFDAMVETDYEGSWEEEKSSIREKLKNLYENYIIKKETVVNQVVPLLEDVRDLQHRVKTFLGMEGV
jgi:hypothetical protein